MVKKSYRKLKVSKDLTRMMKVYYAKMKIAGRLQPVAWVSSGAPVEVLVALGVLPLYPENYGAILGAQRAAVPLIEDAEARGYSPDLCVHRPSPLNEPDLFTQMAPIVVLRGTKQCVDYYRKLKTEVEERVEGGIGAVPDERYRLLWDNIAIWPGLFRFYHLFSRAGACFVCDTYTHAWSTGLQTDDPIEGLARAYTAVYINMSVQARARMMVEMAKRFEVDGAVLHANRSCKPYSLGQHDFRRAVMAEAGVPALILEADMCDTRVYAEGAIRTRVEAFLEMLGG